MVRGCEDVDCERSGAEQARVVAGGVGQRHGMARCEDRVAGGGGVGGGGGGARWRVGESDDRWGGDDDLLYRPLHRRHDPPPHLHRQRHRILYTSRGHRNEFAV